MRQYLREETAGDHAKTERLVDSLDVFSACDRYVRWLKSMSKIHNRFASCHDAASVALGLAPWHHDLSRALHADLKALDALDMPMTEPAIHRPLAVGIGAAYVLEGSGLGARLLIRRARDAGIADTRYLDIMGTVSHTRWPGFVAALDATPIPIAPAAAGARAVFAVLTEALEEQFR